MRFKAGAAIVAAMMGTMAATSASAVAYKFTLNGPYAAVWTIDSQPTPDEIDPNGNSFYLYDVEGNFSAIPGNGPTNYVADIEFYTSTLKGGFYIGNHYDNGGIDLLTTNGPQLFTGSVTAPTFTLGDFTLTNADNADVRYSLNIAAVPEPATWALMLTGFGLVGGAMRVRRTVKFATRTA